MMTWAFEHAREYGLQTGAGFEYIPSAARRRKAKAARVLWVAYADHT